MYIERLAERLEKAAVTIETAANALVEKAVLSQDDLVKKVEIDPVKPVDPDKPIEKEPIGKPIEKEPIGKPVDPEDDEFLEGDENG